MSRFFPAVFIAVSLFISSSISGPQIQFDTKTFDCGTVIEGKTDKLNARFVVKNTGDSVLKLENVKPSCGCTVVKYDTLIQPGKSAKIESQVRIKGYRPGTLSKRVTVTSNAKNESTVRLTITAKIQAIVGVSKNYINLAAIDTSKPETLFLTSTKKDLAVSAVSFTSHDKKGAAAWESELKMNIQFTFSPVDSTTDDGSRVFRLDLFPPATADTLSGKFSITTNHADKKIIEIHGKIKT
jgi:hypothetical protein